MTEKEVLDAKASIDQLRNLLHNEHLPNHTWIPELEKTSNILGRLLKIPDALKDL